MIRSDFSAIRNITLSYKILLSIFQRDVGMYRYPQKLAQHRSKEIGEKQSIFVATLHDCFTALNGIYVYLIIY